MKKIITLLFLTIIISSCGLKQEGVNNINQGKIEFESSKEIDTEGTTNTKTKGGIELNNN